MIEYLEKLVKEREFEKALPLAEQLILNSDNSLFDLMRISHALQLSRLNMGEHHGSLIPGEMTANLARDLECWDYYGVAHLDLSAAYVYLRQYESAQVSCYEFLAHYAKYTWAASHEWMIWYNLGVVGYLTGSGPQAAHCFSKAFEAVERYQSPRFAHGVRQALIGAHLAAGDYGPVPCLLTKCLHYLRHHPEDMTLEESRLWHYVLRSDYAIRTNRLARARKVIQRGLALASGKLIYMFRFHILSARVELLEGNIGAALSNSIVARVYAIRSKRYDLEAEASETMYDILRQRPEAVLADKEPFLFPQFDLLLHERGGL